MAVRTAYDPTAGEILTATNVEKLAGGWIGYAELTSSMSAITAETDLTGLSVAVTVNTSRRIRITGQVRVTPSATGNAAVLYTKEGATILQYGETYSTVVSGTFTVVSSVILTPSAGSHTYKLSLESTGGGTMTPTPSSVRPAFILVEDLGPAA